MFQVASMQLDAAFATANILVPVRVFREFLFPPTKKSFLPPKEVFRVPYIPPKFP